MVMWLLACAEEGGLTPAESLTRLSLDLRGRRPTVAEMDAVAENPGNLDALVDDFLADPAFGDRVEDLFALAFRTRLDRFTPDAEELGLDAAADPAFQAAIGEEPLRLLAWVATQDLPWTDIVTADYTMADEVLAQAWPVDYPEGARGWQPVPWTDGRPAAGVLASNGLWWRYTSTMDNYNRGRANALSRIFLCDDFLARPVRFPRSDAAPGSDELLDQTRSDPSCTSCHYALDPLGSFLYGFNYYYESYYMTPEYNAHAESDWAGGTGISPAWFGTPANGLADLGKLVAADPRFARCTVQTVMEGMLHRDVGAADFDAVVRHQDVFIDAGLTLRPLVRSVVTDPMYLAADVDGAVPVKMVSVEVLATQVTDLTGFEWQQDGLDLMRTDRLGYRTLGGGFDGAVVTQPIRSPNTTVVLVQQRLAEQAAAWAVTHDAAILSLVRGGEGLPLLFRRVLSREPTEEEAAALDTLWAEVATAEGEDAARQAVLTALLRHPDFVLY